MNLITTTSVSNNVQVGAAAWTVENGRTNGQVRGYVQLAVWLFVVQSTRALSTQSCEGANSSITKYATRIQHCTREASSARWEPSKIAHSFHIPFRPCLLFYLGLVQPTAETQTVPHGSPTSPLEATTILEAFHDLVSLLALLPRQLFPKVLSRELHSNVCMAKASKQYHTCPIIAQVSPWNIDAFATARPVTPTSVIKLLIFPSQQMLFIRSLVVHVFGRVFLSMYTACRSRPLT